MAWGGRGGRKETSGKKGQEGGLGGAAGLGSFLKKTGEKRSPGGAGSGCVFLSRRFGRCVSERGKAEGWVHAWAVEMNRKKCWMRVGKQDAGVECKAGNTWSV